MHRTLLLILFFVPMSISFASGDTTSVNRLIRGMLESIIEDSASVGGISPDRTVLKIEYDFSSDGILDLATSDCPILCGNAGCQWGIYLGQASGDLVYLDELFFNDGAITIQRLNPGKSRIYTYSHFSAAEGTIEEYELNSNGIKEISRSAPDTANWDRFNHLSQGKPSPVVVYAVNVLEFMRTRQLIWKPWR